MTFRLYHDPHFKPPRSAAKYEADQRRDASSAGENAAFVAEFLSNYRPSSAGSADPAATFKALRIEARRLSKVIEKGKLRVAGVDSKVKDRKLPKKSAKRAPLKSKADNKNVATDKVRTPHPWLKRKSSLRYLAMTDGNLLSEYFSIETKIEQWRQERELSVDARRKMVLAEQIQVQYEKRHDLLALIYDRALSLDDGASA